MLSWVVILHPEPRRVSTHHRQALGSHWNPSLHPRLFAAPFSRKSFLSNLFRTLASHLKASVSPNSFEINRFRTLCKIPGIGYPLPSFLFPPPLPRVRSRNARIAHFFATSPFLATLAFLVGGGGYPPPSKNRGPK